VTPGLGNRCSILLSYGRKVLLNKNLRAALCATFSAGYNLYYNRMRLYNAVLPVNYRPAGEVVRRD
jgi:hypothetical protein